VRKEENRMVYVRGTATRVDDAKKRKLILRGKSSSVLRREITTPVAGSNADQHNAAVNSQDELARRDRVFGIKIAIVSAILGGVTGSTITVLLTCG
jgi:hypothetical protein